MAARVHPGHALTSDGHDEPQVQELLRLQGGNAVPIQRGGAGLIVFGCEACGAQARLTVVDARQWLNMHPYCCLPIRAR